MFKQRGAFALLTRKDWWNLVLLGIVFYALTQGGQFVTMNYLDTITFSLLLNFSAVVVALLGIVGLREYPSLLQWGGIALFIGGVLLYFLPQGSLVGLNFGFSSGWDEYCF